MAKKWIVVTAGRRPGVYKNWLLAAPHVEGVPGAIFQGCATETEAYAVYGKAGMDGRRRIITDVIPRETLSQPSVRVREQNERRKAVSGVESDGNVSEEVVIQCPVVRSPRPRSIIQRASTLPSQQTPSSPGNIVQRSRTVPELESRSMPSTPRKDRGLKTPPSNVSRSRAISISTNGSASDEDTIPPSPATDVSCSLSPIPGRYPSPSHARSSRSSRRRDEDDQDLQSYRARTVHSARGSKNQGYKIASPSKEDIDTSNVTVRSTTRRGSPRRHQSPKKVAWNQPSPVAQRRYHTPRDRSGSRPPPSPSGSGSSQLTYVSDDGRQGGLGQSTGDSDYFTPSARDSGISDVDSEPPELVFRTSSKRKGKDCAPSPPTSPFPHPSSSSSVASSSPREFGPTSRPSPKKRRDRYTRPGNSAKSQGSHEQTSSQESQSSVHDVCCCTGPCPSCHKLRVLYPPHHPMMVPPVPYPYLYYPPPHMQTGYQLPHYGPPSYPYPYAISQPTDLLPSISSAQPFPPPSGYPLHPPPPAHFPIVHPLNASANPSPVPAPTPPTPPPEPSTSTLLPSPSIRAGSPPMESTATGTVSPEFVGALGQFSQPPQRSISVIDPSYDPRSPYSKNAVVPAFTNAQVNSLWTA